MSSECECGGDFVCGEFLHKNWCQYLGMVWNPISLKWEDKPIDLNLDEQPEWEQDMAKFTNEFGEDYYVEDDDLYDDDYLYDEDYDDSDDELYDDDDDEDYDDEVCSGCLMDILDCDCDYDEYDDDVYSDYDGYYHNIME